MTTRRRFMRGALGAAVTAAALRDDAMAAIERATREAGGATPQDLAGNEDFWFQIQRAYDIDRSIINLNNGGVAPSPRTVLAAMNRHMAFTNQLPPRHLWDVLDPQVEPVRRRLAEHFGCDAEEIAITRNASEALEICLLGLDLKPGDEVLSTTHDYGRMLNTLRQRVAREGIELKTFAFPTPPDDLDVLARLFERNVTPRTKAILMCHITNLTGQIFPVRQVTRMARERGIEVIVDGEHSFGHFTFDRDDMDCDYYGTSLHKWLSAPIGTGFLYVRRDKIERLWPMMAPPAGKAGDIRKFEEIGTHPTAPRLAIAEALTFYEGIGPERKEARLRHLRDLWANRLMSQARFRIYTSLAPEQSCAIGTVGIEGIEPGALSSHLFSEHKILVTPIRKGDVQGIRVTPNTFTTGREIEIFCEAMERAASRGIG